MTTHVHHGSNHDHPHPVGRRLLVAFWLTLGYALVEVAGGIGSGSLALVSDAGHMFSDAAALGVAAFAAWLARRPPSARHTYGFARAEVIAAFINGLVMMAIVTSIAYEAIARLRSPQPVAATMVLGVAGVGLLVNLVVLRLIHGGPHSLNTRAAALHVIGDLAGSVAAIVAGVVIQTTGWTPIDPLLSLVIVLLILWSTFRLLKEALHVLMEGVPATFDLNEVGRGIAEVPGVRSVHDLHIWTPAAGAPALSAHVVVADMVHWDRTLATLREVLQRRFGIDHVTLQPELETGPAPIAFYTRRPGDSREPG